MHKYSEHFISTQHPWHHWGKIIAYDKPNQCATWIKKVVVGSYIIPLLEWYRYYKLFVAETIPENIADIVEFPTQNVRIIRVLYADATTLAMLDLV